MKHVVFAFSSRNEAMRFFRSVRAFAPCSLINTPSAARVGCGLSVRAQERYYGELATELARGGYDGFLGAFAADERGLRPI